MPSLRHKELADKLHSLLRLLVGASRLSHEPKRTNKKNAGRFGYQLFVRLENRPPLRLYIGCSGDEWIIEASCGDTHQWQFSNEGCRRFAEHLREVYDIQISNDWNVEGSLHIISKKEQQRRRRFGVFVKGNTGSA